MEIVFTKQAVKDLEKVRRDPTIWKKAKTLLELLETNPLQTPPPFEKLTGDLLGAYSRRLNIQHRLVYQVFEEELTVKIIRMWTHYE